jgi:DNA-binding IclR family transcriptional regulator
MPPADSLEDRLLALLRSGPAKLYRLAEQAQQPISNVEGMLRDLRARGAVETVQLGDPSVIHWRIPR